MSGGFSSRHNINERLREGQGRTVADVRTATVRRTGRRRRALPAGACASGVARGTLSRRVPRATAPRAPCWLGEAVPAGCGGVRGG